MPTGPWEEYVYLPLIFPSILLVWITWCLLHSLDGFCVLQYNGEFHFTLPYSNDVTHYCKQWRDVLARWVLFLREPFKCLNLFIFSERIQAIAKWNYQVIAYHLVTWIQFRAWARVIDLTSSLSSHCFISYSWPKATFSSHIRSTFSSQRYSLAWRLLRSIYQVLKYARSMDRGVINATVADGCGSNEWEWFFPQSIAIPRQRFAGGTPAVNRNLG